MNIREHLKLVINDRSYLTSVVVLVIAVFIILVLGAVYIRPSELQVPVRYTSYGITNFYRDKWYYMLAFVVFALVMAVTHFLISLKLYALKGRGIAVSFIWLTVAMSVIAIVFILAIYRVIALSQ